MNAPTKTLSQQKREAIVNAATRAFLDDGVQATSMDRLAELAQVSKRTLYNHFQAKEDLVLHVLSGLWEGSKHNLDDFNPAEALEPQLLRLISKEVEFAADANLLGLSRVAVGLFLHRPEVLEQRLGKSLVPEDGVADWLRAAVKAKHLQPMNVDAAAAQLKRLIKGGCYWPQLLNLQPELTAAERKALAKETMEMFLARYKISKH